MPSTHAEGETMKQRALVCTLIFATSAPFAADSAYMVVVEAEREKGLYYCGRPGEEKFTFTPDVAQGCSAEILERYRVRQAKVENDKRENDVWINSFLAESQPRQLKLDSLEVEIHALRETRKKIAKEKVMAPRGGKATIDRQDAKELAAVILESKVSILTSLWKLHNTHYDYALGSLDNYRTARRITEAAFYARSHVATAEIAKSRRTQFISDAARVADDEEVRLARGPVKIGMSTKQALASSWGIPAEVIRTTTAAGTREQWVYGLKTYLYFDRGILTSIQN